MNCGGFYISADFIYWRAENHGFSYAFESTNVAVDPVTGAVDNIGKIIHISPEWDPGFRIGIGWNTRHDFWDIFLNYTWYRNHSEESREVSEAGQQFFPLFPVSSGTGFTGVSAKSTFLMNMGDLEIGRLMYLTRTVAIRPQWGARGGTIHQRFKDHFNNGTTLSNDFTFNGKNNYWGVGPRAGFTGEWHLNQGFSLLGNLAAALLYGRTDVQFVSDTFSSSFNSFTLDRSVKDDFYQLVPNLQLLLGFQWQTCFWCEKMFFKVSAAWETNIWWDQFNIPVETFSGVIPTIPTVGNQPLTMEGLTVNFQWDF